MNQQIVLFCLFIVLVVSLPFIVVIDQLAVSRWFNHAVYRILVDVAFCLLIFGCWSVLAYWCVTRLFGSSTAIKTIQIDIQSETRQDNDNDQPQMSKDQTNIQSIEQSIDIPI